MSILSSTNSGKKAVSLTYEYFREHADEWHEEVLEGIHEVHFTYRMHYGQYIAFNLFNNRFTTSIWVGKPATVLTNLYQLDMLKKYFEAEKTEDFNKYARLICQY